MPIYGSLQVSETNGSPKKPNRVDRLGATAIHSAVRYSPVMGFPFPI